jgi:hypothetical protein
MKTWRRSIEVFKFWSKYHNGVQMYWGWVRKDKRALLKKELENLEEIGCNM